MIRIGFGYDVHQLSENYNLCIGGLIIPHSKGTVGHSDGDVLIHAIIDALLGASNLRDIGYQFSDTASEFKGIDSKILLQRTMDLIKAHDYHIGNVDVTVCLQRPKLKDMIPQMKEKLAPILEVHLDQLSIKATTTEKLGFVGHEEGIAAYAVALLEK